MAVLRDSPEPVERSTLDLAWADAAQRERCLDSLLEDGLATLHPAAPSPCDENAPTFVALRR